VEHHVPIELCVSGLIHIAHAAFVDLSGDFVDAEPAPSMLNPLADASVLRAERASYARR
jgi:hypothetical protein